MDESESEKIEREQLLIYGMSRCHVSEEPIWDSFRAHLNKPPTHINGFNGWATKLWCDLRLAFDQVELSNVSLRFDVFLFMCSHKTDESCAWTYERCKSFVVFVWRRQVGCPTIPALS